MSRIHRQGRDHWSTRSGYINQSNPWARLERPEGEPAHWVGVAITALGLLTIIGGIMLFKGILG